MAEAATSVGLKMRVGVLEKVYKTGRKCVDGFRESMKIAFDKLLPVWNYTTMPKRNRKREVVSGLYLNNLPFDLEVSSIPL